MFDLQLVRHRTSAKLLAFVFVFGWTLAPGFAQQSPETPAAEGTQAAQDTEPPAEEAAEEERIEVELTLDFFTRYVWRGFELNDNDPGLQPSVNVAFPFGLEFNAWASIGTLEGDGGKTELDEVDLTLTYSRNLVPDKLDLTVGLVSYLYMGTQSSVFLTLTDEFEYSLEAFVGLTLSSVWGSPTLSYSRGLGGSDKLVEDGEEVQGTGGDNVGNYLEFGLEQEFALSDKLFLTPAFAAGLQNEYGIDPVISHLQLDLPLSYSLSDKLSVTPSFSVVYIPSPEDINGDDRNWLAWGGISLTYGL
jgi:hypothetical protein